MVDCERQREERILRDSVPVLVDEAHAGVSRDSERRWPVLPDGGTALRIKQDILSDYPHDGEKMTYRGR